MKQTLQSEPGKPMLTAEIAATVIECLKPAVQALLKLHERKFLHVIVVDPVDGKTIIFDGPMVGTTKDYPKDYRAIALKKAALARRTGLNTATVHEGAPHLMTEGDVVYQGGVNYRGLVVAASGAQGPVDEAVSVMVAAQLAAYCQVEIHKLQDEAAKGGPFLVPAR